MRTLVVRLHLGVRREGERVWRADSSHGARLSRLTTVGETEARAGRVTQRGGVYLLHVTTRAPTHALLFCTATWQENAPEPRVSTTHDVNETYGLIEEVILEKKS